MAEENRDENINPEGQQATEDQEPETRDDDYDVPEEATFQVFLAGLYSQTMMALGELENPVTGKREKSLPNARYLIDTIAMLQRKTQGNLNAEESQYLRNLLHDLRMRFVNVSGENQYEKNSEEEKRPEEETDEVEE